MGADSLMRVFAGKGHVDVRRASTESSTTYPRSHVSSGLHSVAAPSETSRIELSALSQEEAERWIREVDYKGNGVVDYESFLSALMGKHIWTTALLENEDQPAVRVFEKLQPRRTRASSDGSAGANLRRKILSAIVDDGEDRRSTSFTPGMTESMRVRELTLQVKDSY